MATRREGFPAKRMLRPLLWGSVVGIAVCAVLLLIAAAVMTSGAISNAMVTPIAMAAATVAAFVGGLVAARLSGERGLLYGAASGLAWFLLVTVISLAALHEIRGSTLLLRAALTVAGGAFGGVLGVNMKKR